MRKWGLRLIALGLGLLSARDVSAQETDITQTPNLAIVGSRKSFLQEVGPGRGDTSTPGSSLFIIARDPFRSIARGRQLFQRKFNASQGLGPRPRDGVGDIVGMPGVAAGFSDSCAGCHGRPRGSAGVGGNVFTRPDSRDAPHLFGLGLVEMLGDEMTTELRAIRAAAVAAAASSGQAVTRPLTTKTVSFGTLRALPSGTVDTSGVVGVDPDLRVRPFFAQGADFSIRAFIVGALQAEMGLEAFDPDLALAAAGGIAETPAGLVLNGVTDTVAVPAASSALDDPDGDGIRDEFPVAVIDHLELYLLNYFKPGLYRQSNATTRGQRALVTLGCVRCHVQDLRITSDRRVADVETVHDAARGRFNGLFSTATALGTPEDDGSGHGPLFVPNRQSFLVRNIYTDLKRHDLGPGFHERNFDGSVTRQFVTEPLWGVGTTAPYGHDGRSINLREVILRHGGEAQVERDAFAALSEPNQDNVIQFLQTLVIFPPPDTASNLDPGNPATPGYPQFGHGSISLVPLFADPSDRE